VATEAHPGTGLDAPARRPQRAEAEVKYLADQLDRLGRADTFGRAWLVIRDFFNERVLRA
jgi:hypothetical protein